jgi:hypothetical protein
VARKVSLGISVTLSLGISTLYWVYATFSYVSLRLTTAQYVLLGFTRQCQGLRRDLAPFGGVLGSTRFLVGFHYVLLGVNKYIAVLTNVVKPSPK